MKKLITLLLAAVMLLSLFGCAAQTPATQEQEPAQNGSKPAAPADKQDTDAEPVAALTPDGELVITDKLAHFAASYDDVRDAIAKLRQAYDEAAAGGVRSVNTKTESAADAAEPEMPAPAGEEGLGSGGSDDYSETNVQVAGIDEGDIVKTDGAYIYAVGENKLKIFSVDEFVVKKVAELTLGFEKYEDSKNSYSNDYKSVREMFVAGDMLAVISDHSSYSSKRTGANDWSYESSNRAEVDFIDITDRTAPKIAATLGQDGGTMTTRLVGDRLFVVSRYYIYNYDDGDMHTFVPALYRNGEKALIDANKICIPVNPSETYTVVTEYDVASAVMKDTAAVLTNGASLYMDAERIVVAGQKHQQDVTAERTESVYKVKEYYEYDATELTAFDITGDGLAYINTALVDGYLDSQFSMDRYNGDLRIVTTHASYSYAVYVDEAMGFENYRWNDDHKTYNNLYVLGADMVRKGAVENLAEDERVYSVRFDGPVGYFCTFRQVDPLFTVDLSDPASPKILSALKIPGFSEYLHVWQSGLLFGLGYDTREESWGEESWTTTDGVKLSMFDVSDPANVTEKWKLRLDYDYSDTMYNHKSAFFDSARNIIGFQAEDGYALYSFTPEDGFRELAWVHGEKLGSWNIRCVRIGEWLYLVGANAIYVLDISDNYTVRATTPI